jgi:hypothetical protein
MIPHILRSPYARLWDELKRDVGVVFKFGIVDFRSTRVLMGKCYRYTKCLMRGHDSIKMPSYVKYVDRALAAKTKAEFEENYDLAENLAKFRQCTKCQQIHRVID